MTNRKNRMRWRVWLVTFCWLTLASAQAAEQAAPDSSPIPATSSNTASISTRKLARRLDAILARPENARGFWGVEIADLESGRVIYAHDAERLFLPASNAKLFTTAAGLALIGPDYRFRTTIESSVKPDAAGRLAGDLVLVGRGDANLSGRQLPYDRQTERPYAPGYVLAQLADQLVAHGLRAVDGDVVADDSFFADERYASGWGEGDLQWEYGTAVSALAINDNVEFLNLRPGAAVGSPAVATLEPLANYYQIVNRLTTVSAGHARHVAVRREPGSRQVEVWGTIPRDDVGTSMALAVEDPASFAAQLLTEMLVQRGVVLHGQPRARHAAFAGVSAAAVHAPIASSQQSNARAVVLAEHVSLPLGEDIRVINKVSQNLHAEMLLRLLGRERGTAGSREAGLAVLHTFLAQAGVADDAVVLDDGCGLSRHDLVTPAALVTLLQYAARQPWGERFRESLPLAGVEGSLATRFATLPPTATLRAKTGSMEHVRSLSGYLTTAHRRRLAFSMLSNNQTLSGEQANAVLEEMLQQAARLK